MFEKKYFRNILKLVRKYEHCLDGYRITISKEQAEIKLSYKNGREYSESVWITGKTSGWGEDKEHVESVYFSIQDELENKFPHVY